MNQSQNETHLVRKQVNFPTVCTYCASPITSNDVLYVEEGITEHVHSLIARKYCAACYTKYGEQKLLRGTNK